MFLSAKKKERKKVKDLVKTCMAIGFELLKEGVNVFKNALF